MKTENICKRYYSKAGLDVNDRRLLLHRRNVEIEMFLNDNEDCCGLPYVQGSRNQNKFTTWDTVNYQAVQ